MRQDGREIFRWFKTAADMPRETRRWDAPADVVGNAVKVTRVETGEIEEDIWMRDAAAANPAGKNRRRKKSQEGLRQSRAMWWMH